MSQDLSGLQPCVEVTRAVSVAAIHISNSFYFGFTFIEMATMPGLLKLEEQLTCPVCLDLYTNPKTLPCLHSFCEACIERFPQDKEGETYYLSCPTCRHHTELPEGGTGAFPVAFTLNNLKEVHSLMKKASDPQQATCDNCTMTNATGYCKDCYKFLCTECNDVHKKWGPTSKHQMLSLAEVAASAFQLLQFQPAANSMCLSHRKPLELFCETCEQLICHHCTVRIHKDHEYDLVTDSYSIHCQYIESSLDPLKEKIAALKKIITAQMERESEIKRRGEGILEEIHQMVEEMINALRQSEKKLSEEAKRITDAKLQVLSRQAKSAQTSLSLLEDVEDYVEQSLKTGTPQQVLTSKKQMMERMSEVTTQINVKELEPREKADFVLSKKMKSLHHIGDIIITTDSSSKRKFHLNPYLDKITPVRTMVQFNHPWGVAVSNDGHVIVTENRGDCVTILNNEGKKVKSFGGKRGSGTVKFSSPRGVAITPDNFVLVTDSNRIQKISMDGDCIASVGEYGSGPLLFSEPDGIAISPITGQVYIVDYDKHCIQVLNPDLTFSHLFGSEGLDNGQFLCPHGIALDSTGLVYVTDRDGHRVQKFTSDGKFVSQFGKKGSGPGQLNSPVGITIDTAATGLVYVSELNNHRISIFTSDGTFINSFGEKGSYVTGITLGADELLYVCHFGKNQIVVY